MSHWNEEKFKFLKYSIFILRVMFHVALSKFYFFLHRAHPRSLWGNVLETFVITQKFSYLRTSQGRRRPLRLLFVQIFLSFFNFSQWNSLFEYTSDRMEKKIYQQASASKFCLVHLPLHLVSELRNHSCDFWGFSIKIWFWKKIFVGLK